MKVVILGASGFLGGWIYKFLMADDRFDAIGTRNFRSKNDFIKIDVCNETDIQCLLSLQPDIIIWSLMAGTDERKLIDQGLERLIQSLSRKTKLVYISTDAFAEGKGNYKEEDSPTYLDGNNPLFVYANAKIDGENMVASLENHIIVRTGPIYGQKVSGEWDHRITALIKGLSTDTEVRRADNIFKTFVHAEDLARSTIELILKDYKGILHLGPPTKESYFTFNVKMAKALLLNELLVSAEPISKEEAIKRSIPLDTSLNTEICSSILETKFREL